MHRSPYSRGKFVDRKIITRVAAIGDRTKGCMEKPYSTITFLNDNPLFTFICRKLHSMTNVNLNFMIFYE